MSFKVDALKSTNLTVSGVFGPTASNTTQMDGLFEYGYDYHYLYPNGTAYGNGNNLLPYSRIHMKGNARQITASPASIYDKAHIMLSDTEFDEPHNENGTYGTDAQRLFLWTQWYSRQSVGAGGSFIQSARYNDHTDDHDFGATNGYMGRLCINPFGGDVGFGTDGPKTLTHIGKLSTNSTTNETIPSAGMGVSADFPGSTNLWLAKHSNAQSEDYWGMALGTLYASGNSYIQTLDKSNSSYYNLLLQPNGGFVGLGTSNPAVPLDIRVGNSKNFSSQWLWYRTNPNIHLTNENQTYPETQLPGNAQIGLYSTYAIGTQTYLYSHGGGLTASDTRIKKNIVDAADAECLETLRLLKPKKYQYRDAVERGEEPVWGFIAQEVRDTLPHATQLRQDVIPNIYELASASSNVITFTGFNTADLESNATTLIRTKGIDGKDHDIHLAEVIDEHTIRVEEDLTEWTGSVDAEGNVITEITTTTITPEEYEALEDTSGYVANISGYQNANVSISVEEYNALEDTTGYEQVVQDYTKTSTTYPGNQLFVYGQEVDDFVFLKKEAIWTVATAALQEVDRIQQQHDGQIADLEAAVTSRDQQIDELRSELSDVVSRLEAVESG